MSRYEIVFILSPQVPDDQLASSVEKVTKIISSRGGAIESVDRWGRRRLAYPIKHFNEGNYVLARFQLDGAAISELEAQLKVSEEIIRHLVVRLDGQIAQPVSEQKPSVEPTEGAAKGETQEVS